MTFAIIALLLAAQPAIPQTPAITSVKCAPVPPGSACTVTFRGILPLGAQIEVDRDDGSKTTWDLKQQGPFQFTEPQGVTVVGARLLPGGKLVSVK
jgi:hypothetical protein